MLDNVDSPLLVLVGDAEVVQHRQAAEEGGAAADNDTWKHLSRE